MKRREEVDPELHILRSVARMANGPGRSELETARFQIYKAFQQRDPEEARRWLQAYRVGLMAEKALPLGALEMAESALNVIEAAI